ncbi:hypothetical protein PRIPAC_79115 [Pristionchus pacificus]|uniref:Transmembrane protein n=1 Tax=Pristionchus pacificus TaxID=54126 RepID=A0A8R1V2K4_PRIPA|nr:hypothetical protein PRIPAC_79115 [Pristionchus pacificus]
MSMISPSNSLPPPKVTFELDDDSQCDVNSKGDGTIYRAVPLSTGRLLLIIAILSIFSFVYLVYAQYHKYLFYSMTSIVGIFIVFIYTYGVFAIIYMVKNDYEYHSQSESPTATTTTGIDEHSL